VEPALESTLRAIYDSLLREQLLQLQKTIAGGIFEAAFRLTCDSLKHWGRPWGLFDDWCIHWVLNNKIYEWIAQEGQPDPGIQRIAQRWFQPLPLEHGPFRVDFDGWDLTEKLRTVFEAEVGKRFEAELRKYCDDRARDARAAGYVETRERRNPDHFAWLACYQVCRMSPSAIAKALGVRLYTVQYSIKSLTEEICLTKNPARYRPASTNRILRNIEKATKFPEPIKLTDRSVAWRLADIRAWLAERAGQ
jgi:predicted DNA-binding transcriptional regulator AlpA